MLHTESIKAPKKAMGQNWSLRLGYICKPERVGAGADGQLQTWWKGLMKSKC